MLYLPMLSPAVIQAVTGGGETTHGLLSPCALVGRVMEDVHVNMGCNTCHLLSHNWSFSPDSVPWF